MHISGLDVHTDM